MFFSYHRISWSGLLVLLGCHTICLLPERVSLPLPKAQLYGQISNYLYMSNYWHAIYILCNASYLAQCRWCVITLTRSRKFKIRCIVDLHGIFFFTILSIIMLHTCSSNYPCGAAVAKWLSSWLAEQGDWGSIPGLATWIFRDWLSPASKSRYGWKKIEAMSILNTTRQLIILVVRWCFMSLT